MLCDGTPISEHFLPGSSYNNHLPRLVPKGKEFYTMLLSQGRTPIIGVCEELGYFVGYLHDEFVLMWCEAHDNE